MNQPALSVGEFSLISHRAAVYCGMSGIMGGCLLFMGDMLLFYAPVATDKFEVMGHFPAWRIVLSGQSALLAVSFYVLACVQIQYAFEPTKNGFGGRFAALLYLLCWPMVGCMAPL